MKRWAKPAALAVAIAIYSLAGTPKADAATNIVYGFVPESATVTNGQHSYFDVYVGSSLSLSQLKTIMQIGNGKGDTNVLKITGSTIFVDSSYVATNGYFNGLELNGLSSASTTPSSAGRLTEDIATLIPSQGAFGTNVVTRYFFDVAYVGATNYSVLLSNVSAQATDTSGGVHRSTGGAPDVYNLIAQGSIVTVVVPEPSTPVLVVGGLAGLFALRKLGKRQKQRARPVSFAE